MRRVSLPLILVALALAGCGQGRAPVPDPARPAPGAPTRAEAFAAAGVTFRAPQAWFVRAAPAPAVATVSSGDAVLTVWRYPRTEPPPRTLPALAAARDALVAEARRRSPRLRVRARVAKVAGAPAIVLTGRQPVDGHERGVRSVHVFAHGGEVVLDGLAPVAAFPAVDAGVFRAVVGSLRLRAPRT